MSCSRLLENKTKPYLPSVTPPIAREIIAKTFSHDEWFIYQQRRKQFNLGARVPTNLITIKTYPQTLNYHKYGIKMIPHRR